MNDHGPEAKISFFIIFSEMNLFLGTLESFTA